MAVVINLMECQPRFVAYCQANGLTEGDEFKTYEYIIWVSRMITDFKKSFGMKHTDTITSGMQEELTQWIFEQIKRDA